MNSKLVTCALPAAFGFFLSPLAGQWIDYPTAGVPRLPDGKPDLSAPAPRTADGKPDFSGLWEMKARGGRSPGSRYKRKVHREKSLRKADAVKARKTVPCHSRHPFVAAGMSRNAVAHAVQDRCQRPYS